MLRRLDDSEPPPRSRKGAKGLSAGDRRRHLAMMAAQKSAAATYRHSERAIITDTIEQLEKEYHLIKKLADHQGVELG